MNALEERIDYYLTEWRLMNFVNQSDVVDALLDLRLLNEIAEGWREHVTP